MSGQLQPYDKYKDSGFEWIGKIPVEWKPSKLNYVASLVSGGTPSKEREDFWAGSIPWISPKDMKSRRIQDSEDHISAEAVLYSGLKYIPADSLLFVVRGMILIHTFPVCRTDHISTINQDMKALLLSPEMDIEFMHFYLEGLSKYVLTFSVDEAAHGTLVIRMEGFGKFPILIPPLFEQKTIATYLDKQTSRIDTLISEQKQLIELLKEKRQALISHCVTKGLDPNVPMKDSGVEWLGMVPEHWDVVIIRRIADDVLTGGTPATISPSQDFINGMNWYTPGDFTNDMVLQSASKKVSLLSLSQGEVKVIPAGSVLIVSIGATLGKCALIINDSSANQQVNAIIPKKKVDSYFLTYSLLAKTEMMQFMSNASTIGIMNQEKTKELWTTFPPIYEQQVITTYLDKQTSRIDTLISEAESTIALMQEHRSALISAVVTGKVKPTI